MTYIIVGLASLALGWLMRKNRVPKFIQDWLKQRDEAGGLSVEEALLDFVKEAETFQNRSGAEKKAWVVEMITLWASARLKFPIPESLVGTIVEFAYQQYKKRV